MAMIVMTEDDKALAVIFEKWLITAGHKVTQASNGIEGIREVSFGGNIDLLMTDLMMPEMSGDELITAIQTLVPDCPIVVVSASADERILNEVRGAENVRSVLSKPIRRYQLLEAIEHALA